MRSTSGPALVPASSLSTSRSIWSSTTFGPDQAAPIWRADEEKCDRETVIKNMLAGEYKKPIRVVAFNTAEGWSQDVSEEIAWEVLEARAGTRGRSARRNALLCRVSSRGRDRAICGECIVRVELTPDRPIGVLPASDGAF